MRRTPLILAMSLVPLLAHAESAVTLRSYWDQDRTTIYSDVMLIHDDGRAEVVSEIGGSVDDVGMIQIALYSRPPARLAFVPTRNDSSAKLRWAGSWVYITPDSAGSPEVPGDGETDALNAALGTWNAAVEPCSYMRFVLRAAEPMEVGLDGKNTVKFRNDRWCRPARGDQPEKCYDEGATAITNLFFIDKASRADNGMLLDADIEINSVNYAIAVGCETRCMTDARTGIVEDLQNTLTHELGHVLGLDHTCWPFARDGAPLTDDGVPAPSCSPLSSLPAAVVEATMYNYQESMETKKRTPEADDIDGICSDYPIADDPKLYEEVDLSTGGACRVVAGPGSGRRLPFAVLLFAAVGCLALRGRACSRTRRR